MKCCEHFSAIAIFKSLPGIPALTNLHSPNCDVNVMELFQHFKIVTLQSDFHFGK